jgi:acyl-lipid omega-6 desaturase (Delta-12 desaturase)
VLYGESLDYLMPRNRVGLKILSLKSVNWAQKLAPYRVASNGRAVFELALTLVIFVALWIAAYLVSFVHPWLSLVMAVPAAGFLVRLFMLQHDCGHLAMFTSKKVNDWVGRGLGVLTLTPYDYWRHSHAMHHATSGNLDRRGIGDIRTLTLAEYQQERAWGRFLYRLYRNPVVLFVIGPIYLFLLQHRLPPETFRQGPASWIGVLGTNGGIVVLIAGLMALFGWKAVLLVHLPIVIVGAAIGVWLFYVQHQFDPTHWEHQPEWNAEAAALEGCSCYDLPKPLMWLTGNIGIHHLHHLSSRIPFYRLPQVLKDFPVLKEQAHHLTFWQSIKCINLALWDEGNKKLISFRLAHQTMKMAA